MKNHGISPRPEDKKVRVRTKFDAFRAYWYKHTIAIVSIMTIVIVIVISVMVTSYSSEKLADQPVTETGQVTWKMATLDYGNNRWFTDGIVEIQSATTEEEATIAAQVWLEKIKTDPNLLVGAAKFFLKRDVNKEALVDANGNATDATIQLVTELSLAIATAQTIVPAEAPADGYNSGVENGTIVQSSGVSGDRTAIQITLANGENIWILGRCGNPVTTESSGLPTGKTDNPSSTPTGETNIIPPNTPPDNSKDASLFVEPPQGVTQQPAGDLTDGQQSADQIKSGDTSGSVVDNPVSSDTTSNSVTSDTGNSVNVGETSSEQDDVSNDVKDDSSTVYDDGGTNGNTEIPEP